MTTPHIARIDVSSTDVTIEFSDGINAVFDHFWLRDHATDDASFDSRSHQRELFTAAVPLDIEPVSVELDSTNDGITIAWPDAAASSVYPATFLRRFAEPEPGDGSLAAARVLWGDGKRPVAEPVPFDAAVSGNAERLLAPIARDGFVLLTGCPTNTVAVQQVADQLGYVRDTVFGGIWTFAADEAMADSAYTPKLLRPHTDGTYSHDAPGLQLLLCCHVKATGGESVLVDGVAIYERMAAEAPELLEVLRRVDVPGQYIGDGHHLVARRPVFRCDTGGNLVQVSFNNYDRAPFRLPPDESAVFYKALRLFDEYANDASMQWQHTLAAGEMLVFDNWRVMHGRGAFRGEREMAGCYVNREDLESAWRALHGES